MLCCGLAPDTGRGTLYLSDASGIIFSKSLDDHLYPNFEDLTDFYSVQSMRGVYIASQLASDNSIHTVISYNRGGEWQPIARPEGLPCADESKVNYGFILE
jgi:sortilin